MHWRVKFDPCQCSRISRGGGNVAENYPPFATTAPHIREPSGSAAGECAGGVGLSKGGVLGNSPAGEPLGSRTYRCSVGERAGIAVRMSSYEDTFANRLDQRQAHP